jgi:hypothetical protein
MAFDSWDFHIICAGMRSYKKKYPAEDVYLVDHISFFQNGSSSLASALNP